MGQPDSYSPAGMILYRTREEYDTKNRQHVRLIWDPFIDWLRRTGWVILNAPRMLAIYIACASARLRERCIVPIDVPCVLHLYVHVWVRHRLDIPTKRSLSPENNCRKKRSRWYTNGCKWSWLKNTTQIISIMAAELWQKKCMSKNTCWSWRSRKPALVDGQYMCNKDQIYLWHAKELPMKLHYYRQ